jgi:hypothetical protein
LGYVGPGVTNDVEIQSGANWVLQLWEMEVGGRQHRMTKKTEVLIDLGFSD